MIWLVGWLFIALECKAPRLIIPGVVGPAALAGAVLFLLSRAPEPASSLWLALAVALFLAEAAWPLRYIAGLAGTLVLAYVFCFVFAQSLHLAIPWAIAGSILPGALLTFTADRARQARLAKRMNL